MASRVRTAPCWARLRRHWSGWRSWTPTLVQMSVAAVVWSSIWAPWWRVEGVFVCDVKVRVRPCVDQAGVCPKLLELNYYQLRSTSPIDEADVLVGRESCVKERQEGRRLDQKGAETRPKGSIQLLQLILVPTSCTSLPGHYYSRPRLQLLKGPGR